MVKEIQCTQCIKFSYYKSKYETVPLLEWQMTLYPSISNIFYECLNVMSVIVLCLLFCSVLLIICMFPFFSGNLSCISLVAGVEFVQYNTAYRASSTPCL